jgi:hypothetical protein
MKRGNRLVFTISLFLVLLALLAGVRHGSSPVKKWHGNGGGLYVTLYDEQGEHLANVCGDDLRGMPTVSSWDTLTPGVEYWEVFRVMIYCKVYIWGMP